MEAWLVEVIPQRVSWETRGTCILHSRTGLAMRDHVSRNGQDTHHDTQRTCKGSDVSVSSQSGGAFKNKT